jgi:glutathione S-transferase
VITVFNFAPAWGLPTPSPFGLKLEAYLRFANIAYECEFVQRPVNSPKGTVPWIRDNDLELADTGFIIEHLQQVHGDRLNDGLTVTQLATAHAVRRMVEENLARIIGYTRWLTDENWPATREVGFGAMDEPWRSNISAKARERIRENMHLHGIGRHTPDEVQSIGLQDVKTIEKLLADSTFLFDNRPREVDASVFGILAQYIIPPLQCGISDYARNSKTLTRYCENILAKYFPDHDRAV